MSDQPLCERSSRTGVRSTRIGKRRVLRLAGEEQGVDAERMLVHAADAEHPPIAAAAPDRPADLVGEVLEGDVLVGLGQGAGDGAVRPVAAHGLEERGDRLLVPAFHQVLEPVERDQARAAAGRASPGCRSDTARGGTATPGPARRGCRASGGTARAPRRRGASRPGRPPATRSRAERSRTAGSAWVIVSMRSGPAVDMVGLRGSGWSRRSGLPMRSGGPVIAAVPCSTRTTDSSSRARIRSRSAPARARAIWASTMPNLTPRL